MSDSYTLGDLQLAIMRALWRRREATVADVHLDLRERGLAFTTIATMLTKMERKGVVRHRAEGRRFVYAPAISEQQVRRSMVAELTERLFGGEATELVSHLLEHDIDRRELRRVKALVAAHERHERKEGH